jgi:hypothetical protein
LVVCTGIKNFVCNCEGKSQIRVFQNRILMTIFAPKREEVTGCRKFKKRNFIICPLHQILLELSKSCTMRWAGFVARMEEINA